MVVLAVDPSAKILQGIIRHIEDVKHDCQILGSRLIERGDADLGRMLIANGFIHDHSKFEGVEWDHFHKRSDPLFTEAWRHHVTTNPHHPEYWAGGISEMPRVYLAEMVCDWHSRSAELDGGGLRRWIETDAMPRFEFSASDQVGKQVTDFVELLLERFS